jgi:hypothetical protein
MHLCSANILWVGWQLLSSALSLSSLLTLAQPISSRSDESRVSAVNAVNSCQHCHILFPVPCSVVTLVSLLTTPP